MPVETHVDHARDRVEAERSTAAAKRDGLAAFRARVADLPVAASDRLRSDGSGIPIASRPGQSRQNAGHAVVGAFDETVRPHCEDTQSQLEAIQTELSESIAVALASAASPTLTPDLHRAVLARTDSRLRELDALLAALDDETDALADAAATVERISDWIVTADETALSTLGFAALQERHDALAAHRERCETLATERQAGLEAIQSDGGDVALHHRSLVVELYTDFPVDHPVLATAVRLDAICGDCQRAVRNHLVRRA